MWVGGHYVSVFHKSWVGWGISARAHEHSHLRISGSKWPIVLKFRCVARDPIVTRFTRVGGGVTTFACACPVSLSRKPLSPDINATPKKDLSLSRSLVHRQTWRLTGINALQVKNRLSWTVWFLPKSKCHLAILKIFWPSLKTFR